MALQNRRNFLTAGLAMTAGAGLGIPGAKASASTGESGSGNKLKVVVVGAHPDDPETICGGAMALYSDAGHEVVSAYFTRGEAGIQGVSHDEAANIRTGEALEACKILGARAEFLGQVDGSCEITPERYSQLIDFIKKEDPDIIFTHWPIDTHRDHRICSVLVYDAWLHTGRRVELYYCEAMTGSQSQTFSPTDYLDISPVIERKHKACAAHVSQGILETYHDHHGKMEKFRGMEFGCAYAEAFVCHSRSSGIKL